MLRVCYICIPECVARVLYILMHTFVEKHVYTTWADTLLVNTQGFSYDLRSRRVEVEAHFFYMWFIYVKYLYLFKASNRIILLIMKKIFLLLFMLTPILVYANVLTCEIDGITYTLYYNKTAEVTSGKSAVGKVVIPSSVIYDSETYSVTEIHQEAFLGCKTLTSITIPNSVTTIGDHAFSWCSNLTSAIIGNSVTDIGTGAFGNCSALTSITIPNSVTTISNSAFRGCESFTSVTIPNSVTEIYNYAFYGCSALTLVNIGSSVTKIGQYAFENCNKLKTVRCYASIPPYIDQIYSFPYSLRKNITVYVHCDYENAYKASNWRIFTIKGRDKFPTGIEGIYAIPSNRIDVEGRIFDISGRIIYGNSSANIQIKNGKKYFIK